MVGRLRPDATIAVAQADLDAIAARLAAAYPRTNEGRGVLLRELRTAIAGETRPGLVLLLSAAVVVLLVVCANVAGLLLTRALAGTRDLAIRSALGAGRSRLVRGALVESGLIAAAGGLAGLAIAWVASRRIAGLDDSLGIPLHRSDTARSGGHRRGRRRRRPVGAPVRRRAGVARFRARRTGPPRPDRHGDQRSRPRPGGVGHR